MPKPKIKATPTGEITGHDVALMRQRLGWKIPQFAELLSVSVATVTRWENCDAAEIPADPHGRRLLCVLRDVLDNEPRARERMNRVKDEGPHRMLFMLLGLYFGDAPWMRLRAQIAA